MAHFEPEGPGAGTSSGVLIRQSVPVTRVFMTYLETAHMNRRFREAEVVLFQEEGTLLF
jgi:hypothetical protein